jgi:hypothetical protein
MPITAIPTAAAAAILNLIGQVSSTSNLHQFYHG